MKSVKARRNKLQQHFPCDDCGAVLKFSPGTETLVCEYCGKENLIVQSAASIQEYDLKQALQEYQYAKTGPEQIKIQCQECGAGFLFESSVQAGECPFCATPVVRQSESKRIQPKSLLPFQIDASQAKQSFKKWLGSLWFAPNAVKKFARSDAKLSGVYLPYWTFDSQTETDYSGMRGDTYYVTRPVRVSQNGKVVTRMKRVPKIRWTPVRGHVSRFFDDVLIGASRSLPRKILDSLHPWPLQNLIPFDEQYLSGYRSEFYQLGLEEGYDHATRVMEQVISRDIALDIGGDHQRIHNKTTRHSQRTYKHCLLPVWMANFKFRNKTYRFAINACTGKVQGERPYSYWKIGFALIFALLVIAVIVFFAEGHQLHYSSTVPDQNFYYSPY